MFIYSYIQIFINLFLLEIMNRIPHTYFIFVVSLKFAFVIIHLTRYYQVVSIYTLQAANKRDKVICDIINVFKYQILDRIRWYERLCKKKNEKGFDVMFLLSGIIHINSKRYVYTFYAPSVWINEKWRKI